MSVTGLTAKPPKFAAAHPWDRNFFLLMVALLWLGILMGFAPEIIRNFQLHKPPHPLIVHVHAFVFVAWLCLLTTQVLLIRAGRADLHRRLGAAGACLYAAMLVLGPATAVTVDRIKMAAPGAQPSFLSVQLGDIMVFAVLGGAALAYRKVPSAHKRLIILATICISNAGFSRWWSDPLEALLGQGYWSQLAQLYLSDFLLIGALGLYDFVTRHRLHPAYIFGAAWGLSIELLAVWLYVSPWWKPIAIALLGGR